MDVAAMIRSGVAQVAAGKEVNSDNIGGDPSETLSNATEDVEESVHANESTTDSEQPFADSDEDTQADPNTSEDQAAPEQSEAKVQASSKEVITVTGEDGKKRRLEIDYSDRESIKKAHLLAAGARKWQAERDQDRKKATELESKFTELSSRFDFLDKAWKEGGVEGVVDLLEGKKGAYQESVKRKYETEKFLAEATPSEIKEYERQQRELAAQQALEKERQENAKFREQITKERETAEERAMEARLHPVFDKYRFAGKLGDESDEHIFDQMLWKTAMDNLAPYEDEGLEITPELIDREFRKVAMTINKRVNVQAVKKAAKAVEQKKQEATENVQAKVRSGYKAGGVAAEAQDLLDRGDISALLKGASKYLPALKRNRR